MPTAGPLPCFLLLGLLCALPRPAAAFCGFFVSGADEKLYNSASHVVLLRRGNRTVMSMSNNYRGPAEDFAMVVPVPVVLQKRQVKTLLPSVFRHIDELSAPRLVEYWEQDPCDADSFSSLGGGRGTLKPARMAASGVGIGDSDFGVKIEAKFTSGEYQVLILSAQESTGLDSWLRQNNYKIPQGAAEALAPYVRDQMKFFVAKVDRKKVKHGKDGLIQLSPLQFSFDSQDLRLPVRLGLLNAEDKQDLIVYVLHPSKRFEVANYPNVFIPTNLEVVQTVKKSFGAFYAELFDETLRQNNNRAVITEYAWDTASCDPCPGPPLEQEDIATLGGGGGDDSSWVVTRLHTRYDRQTLSEDLIFRAARPAEGGRADESGLGPQEGTLLRGGQNNFQGRYVIRHYWTKKTACDHPHYGVWGEDPRGEATPRVARDLATAPRGQVKLSEVVRSKVPSLGLGVPRRAPTGHER